SLHDALPISVVGIDVGTAAVGVEQIAEGLAVGADAGADGRAALEHAHRIAGGRDLVDLDLLFLGREVVLLDVVGQTAFVRDGEARCHLHGCGAVLHVRHRVRAGEYAAGGDQRNVDLFGLHPVADLGDDGGQV